MSKVATLYVPSNISSVSFDGDEYPIRNGKVEVPSKAIEPLIRRHGLSDKPFAKPEEKIDKGDRGDKKTAIAENK
jgi:hypothetical protein